MEASDVRSRLDDVPQSLSFEDILSSVGTRGAKPPKLSELIALSAKTIASVAVSGQPEYVRGILALSDVEALQFGQAWAAYIDSIPDHRKKMASKLIAETAPVLIAGGVTLKIILPRVAALRVIQQMRPPAYGHQAPPSGARHPERQPDVAAQPVPDATAPAQSGNSTGPVSATNRDVDPGTYAVYGDAATLFGGDGVV